MLVYKNTIVNCWFMLVRSALTMLTDTAFDFKNELVNVEMNFN